MDILNQMLGPNKAQALAVIIMDIDHFKAVNDRFGHACGDLVLKDFATRLSAAIGRDDLVGRIGGEEFLLVLSGSRMLSAESTMQKLLATLTEASPLSDVPDFRYRPFGRHCLCRSRRERERCAAPRRHGTL